MDARERITALSRTAIARGGEAEAHAANATLGWIVALGASAGGLAPLEEFFSNIPSTTQAAFVVIQHLSPDYRSFLDQLRNAMPTARVEHCR